MKIRKKRKFEILINEKSMFFSIYLVTNKVTAGAKSFGSFFSGAVNKAGASVAKIKDSVKDNVS